MTKIIRIMELVKERIDITWVKRYDGDKGNEKTNIAPKKV